MTKHLNMGENRILNMLNPRYPEESLENQNNPVTGKYINSLFKDSGENADNRYLNVDGDNSVN